MASLKKATKDDEKALAQVQVQTNLELLEEVRKSNAKSRAQLERIAATTDHAGTTRAADARRALENDEKRFKIQQQLTGRTAENTTFLREQNDAIELQKENMEAQRKELEALGLKAEDQASYRKEQMKLAKMELKQAKASGSKEAEIEAKKKLADLRQTTFLGKISNSLTGILEGTKDKIKGGLSGFKKFAFGALAVAALAFLNSPKFEELRKTIVDTIVPILAYLYDKVIKPLATIAFEKLKQLLISIKGFIDGDKGILTVLGENKLIFSLIAVKIFGLTAILKAFSVTAGLVGKGLMLFNSTYRAQVLMNLKGHIAMLKGKAFAMFGTAVGIISKIGIFLKTAIFIPLKGILMSPGAAFLPITLIAGAIIAFIAYWDEIEVFLRKIGLGPLIDGIKNAFNAVVDAVKSIPEGFMKAVDAVKNFDFKGFFIGPDGIITKIGKFFGDLFDFDFSKLMGELLGKAGKIGKSVAKFFGFGSTDDVKQSNTANRESMRGNTGTGVGSGRSFGDDDSDLEDLSGMFADPNRARAHARARARARASELKGGRGDAAYANLPRSNGQGRGFVPAQREATPPPAIVNAPTTVNSPSTTNVSQNATSLAPTDRVLDQLSVAI